MFYIIILAMFIPSFTFSETLQEESIGYRTITAYNAVEEQTDDTPCIGALKGIDFCNHKIPIVATNEVPLGSLVKINNTIYLVADRTNKRYKYRYDILFRSEKDALEFGKQTLLVSKIQ